MPRSVGPAQYTADRSKERVMAAEAFVETMPQSSAVQTRVPELANPLPETPKRTDLAPDRRDGGDHPERFRFTPTETIGDGENR